MDACRAAFEGAEKDLSFTRLAPEPWDEEAAVVPGAMNAGGGAPSPSPSPSTNADGDVVSPYANEAALTPEDEAPLDPAHPIQLLASPDGVRTRPHNEVPDGLLAKLSRPVYYELASHAFAGQDGRMGVWSHNQFFALE